MYFAKIDLFFRVLKVIVADQDFIDRQPGLYVPCDLNGVYPKNYPGIGYTYDPEREAFIAPKPFPSWSLNEDTCQWVAPVEMPNDGEPYAWNEDAQSWDEV